MKRDLMLNRHNIHIATLSETWLEPDIDLRLSNYNLFGKTDMMLTGEWQFCVISQPKHATPYGCRQHR